MCVFLITAVFNVFSTMSCVPVSLSTIITVCHAGYEYVIIKYS